MNQYIHHPFSLTLLSALFLNVKSLRECCSEICVQRIQVENKILITSNSLNSVKFMLDGPKGPEVASKPINSRQGQKRKLRKCRWWRHHECSRASATTRLETRLSKPLHATDWVMGGNRRYSCCQNSDCVGERYCWQSELANCWVHLQRTVVRETVEILILKGERVELFLEGSQTFTGVSNECSWFIQPWIKPHSSLKYEDFGSP